MNSHPGVESAVGSEEREKVVCSRGQSWEECPEQLMPGRAALQITARWGPSAFSAR